MWGMKNNGPRPPHSEEELFALAMMAIGTYFVLQFIFSSFADAVASALEKLGLR